MGHAANLHKGQQVTIIVTAFILRSLKKEKKSAYRDWKELVMYKLDSFWQFENKIGQRQAAAL